MALWIGNWENAIFALIRRDAPRLRSRGHATVGSPMTGLGVD